MSTIEERLERMRELKAGIKGYSFFSPSESAAELVAVNQQIIQDEARLDLAKAGLKTEASQAYCPSSRTTQDKWYCKNFMGGDEPCANFERCYD